MPLRKAIAYSKHKKMAYTRKSNVKSKSYIKAIPSSKVTKYIMGDIKKFNEGRFPFIAELQSCEEVFMRDNAIEAARQMIHRQLDEHFKGNYYFILCIYPHHILREKKMLTGAGADRLQTGMALSFGKPVGIAAHVKQNGSIFKVAVSSANEIAFVRNALKKAAPKLPCGTRVISYGLEKK